MESSEFVHLHLHTAYSLLDGAIRLNDLSERAVQYGMPAVAITDHGNMYGAVDFYIKMKKAGIKPIIGCEIYITPFHRSDRAQRSAYHLVLLAENNTGYENLVRLVSKAYLEGFYRKPRIDYELLEQYHEGLIGLSACLAGEIPSAILNENVDEARRIAARYRDIFGSGSFFLEVQRNGIAEQDKVNKVLLTLSKDLGIPLVATNDSHYLDKEDKRAHEVLLCIQTGSTLQDPNRFSYDSDDLYFRSSEEMIPLFTEFPDAVKNTLAIAERCNVELTLDKPMLPRFQPPDGKTLDDYLDEVAHESLNVRLSKLPYNVDRKAYQARLENELKIIKSMGFSGYFLIVWDFIRYAREKNIPVGPGRGSGAGSLVAYALQITDLDPIAYDLLFERFLNPERVTLPDFDIDFCKDRRDEVIHYVSEKYGHDKVGQIVTFNSMKAKAVIRDVGRVMEIPLKEIDQLAKLIPPELNITLDKALEQDGELRSKVQKDKRYTELFNIARRLEGLNRHAGLHAAGVVISEKPLWETVPVKKEGDSVIVTQYAKGEVEKVGLVKFDFLGLKTLTIIHRAQTMINRTRKTPLDIQHLSYDDPKVYELISSGRTFGVFQMEGEGFTDMIKNMKPSSFEDIIAAVALYRPGPMKQIPNFIARKHGKQKIDYLHPDLEPILKGTYGLIVYQEQVMQISQKMAGFSMGHADLLRRAMGKKIQKEMDRLKDTFINGDPEMGVPGAVSRGYDARLAEKVFELMQEFAKYGFNKSHAAGYAVLSYQTAYLKTYYPKEFMAALMSCERDRTDKIVKAINECRAMNIDVLPPDVNSSEADFTVVTEGIRFGLAAVKNVGVPAVEAIIKERSQNGPFTSLFDFCRRVDLRAINRRVIESLIKCGAFDSTGGHRSAMMAALDQALDAGQAAFRDRLVGQASLFDAMASTETKALTDPELPDIDEWPIQQRLAFEKETLGFYVTGHPLLEHRSAIKAIVSTDSESLRNCSVGEKVVVCGIPAHVKKHLTRRKEQMAFLTLEDLNGSMEIILPPPVWEKSKENLETDKILVITGETTQNDRNENGHIRIVAGDIITLDEARRTMTKGVILELSSSENGTELLSHLKDLIHKNRGSAKVQIKVMFSDGEPLETVIVDLGKNFRIEPSRAFLDAVERMDGLKFVDFRW